MRAIVAMVGLSHPHSGMYLETLEALDEVAGVVLVDEDRALAEATAGRVGKAVGATGDLDAALARADVTHALIALPNDRTPAALVRAIDAGKGVFTEKPGARTAAELEPVLAALARRPVPFAVAYLNRWTPAVQQIRELVRGGAIGRLTSVELRMVTTQVAMRDPGSWLFDRAAAGGGILAWLACHWFDAVRFATGDEYARVTAELGTTSGEAISVEDTAAVAFRMAGGAIGTMHAGYLLAVGKPGYRGGGYDIALNLRGTLGAIAYHRDVQEDPLVLESVAPGWRTAQRREYRFTPPASPGYGGLAGLDVVRAFLAARPGELAPADAVDALRLLELLDAVYESARSGRAVEVARRRPPS